MTDQPSLFEESPQEETTPRSPKFPEMTITEKNRLARDIATEKVFMDIFVRKEDAHHLATIFIPMGLMSWDGWTEEDKAQLGGVYEYMSEASPRSINGYPSFFSCKLLHKDDRMYVLEKAREIRKLLDRVASE